MLMPTLLLVDDNEALAAFTALNLKTLMPEMKVYTANTCQEARNTVKKHIPDLVMLDQLLPDGDGYNLWQELQEQLPQCRAIFLTANASHLTPRLPLGVLHLLNKPFDIEELVPLIRQALIGQQTVDEKAMVEVTAEQTGLNRHALVNQLTSLIAGLRAFSIDLHENAGDAAAIHRLTDEYIDNLVETARRAGKIIMGHELKGRDGE